MILPNFATKNPHEIENILIRTPTQPRLDPAYGSKFLFLDLIQTNAKLFLSHAGAQGVNCRI